MTRFALLLVSFGALAQPVQAHDGPHAARVATDVVATRKAGEEITVRLRLTPLDGAVQLQGVWSSSAELVAWEQVEAEKPGGMPDQVVTLRFDDGIPSLFTITLDFGDAGVTTALIVPK